MHVTAPTLCALSDIRHTFFTRAGGVSEGLYASLNAGLGSNDDPARVAENRRRMAMHLGVSADALISCHQIHSPDVIVATGPHDGGPRPKADAVVSATPGVACGVATADCGPVLFADPIARVVGAAHAGWKGALGGVLEATVEAMEKLGASRADTVAVIGPLIRQESYEVSKGFEDTFLAQEWSYSRFFRAGKSGHAFFDLPGFIRERLVVAGVGQVEDLGLDTYADEARFFSFRRTTHRGEPDYGRHIAAITLEG